MKFLIEACVETQEFLLGVVSPVAATIHPRYAPKRRRGKESKGASQTSSISTDISWITWRHVLWIPLTELGQLRVRYHSRIIPQSQQRYQYDQWHQQRHRSSSDRLDGRRIHLQHDGRADIRRCRATPTGSDDGAQGSQSPAR